MSRRQGSGRGGPADRTRRAAADAGAGGAAVPAVPTLAVEGELTVQTAADRRPGLLAHLAQAQRVALDLSGVTEMDTAGLQLLLLLRREAEHLGRTLDLVGASPTVADTLAIVHLDPTLAPLRPVGAQGAAR